VLETNDNLLTTSKAKQSWKIGCWQGTEASPLWSASGLVNGYFADSLGVTWKKEVKTQVTGWGEWPDNCYTTQVVAPASASGPSGSVASATGQYRVRDSDGAWLYDTTKGRFSVSAGVLPLGTIVSVESRSPSTTYQGSNQACHTDKGKVHCGALEPVP